ncbi:MAG: hypothetical protein GXP08_16735 [Gammaproteobacteria bacterium]|nr:hypothetical protein [Gammaproteobacteria bacterium]
MRFLGRSLFIIILLLLIGFSYEKQWYSKPWSGLQKSTTLLEYARPSPTYLLNKTKWLKFALDNRGDVLTVISNASITRSNAIQSDITWKYAIDYQILNAAGTLLKQKTYHHRTRLTQYYDKIKKTLLTRTFYLNDSLMPTDGSIMRINTEGLDNPAILQLKLASHSTALNEVMVRIYQPDPIPVHKLASTWQRLSAKQKVFLGRGSVYGPELLREQEKRSLLRNRSVPIGPQGVRGQDYQDRVLYFLRDYPDELVEQKDQAVLPVGLFVDTWLRGVIAIPKQGVRLAVQFTPIESSMITASSHLDLQWTGHGPSAPKRQKLILNTQTSVLLQHFDGGTLEIQSPIAGVVRAYAVTGNSQQELDIAPLYLRSYQIDMQSPITYLVEHTQNMATPFRVDLRVFTSPLEISPHSRAKSVSYEIMDKQKNIIKQGKLSIDTPISVYDRLSMDHRNWQLSDPSRHYFLLPKKAAKIRFTSKQPVLLTAYSRPPDLARILQVPQDYYTLHDNQKLRQPAWFRVRAVNNTILENNNQTVLLRIQRRPREKNEHILAGNYLWENYQPSGSWRARYLLAPRNNTLPTRHSALGITFRTLPAQTVVPIEFQALPNREQVTPSLVYLQERVINDAPQNHPSFMRNNSPPNAIDIILNGKHIYHRNMTNSRGIIKLPRLPAGKHNIEIKSPQSTQWFINYATTSDTLFMKRLAYRLSAKGLHFIYNKTSPEDALSAQLFLPYGTQHHVNVNVNIDLVRKRGIGPFRNWSFLQRTYKVVPDNEQRIVVLNTHNEFVGNSQRLFITLGSDLPIGQYRIHVTPEQNINAYLLLYRLTPGQFERRVFFSESPLNNQYAME